jgi:hypothetical protein
MKQQLFCQVDELGRAASDTIMSDNQDPSLYTIHKIQVDKVSIDSSTSV